MLYNLRHLVNAGSVPWVFDDTPDSTTRLGVLGIPRGSYRPTESLLFYKKQISWPPCRADPKHNIWCKEVGPVLQAAKKLLWVFRVRVNPAGLVVLGGERPLHPGLAR